MEKKEIGKLITLVLDMVQASGGSVPCRESILKNGAVSLGYLQAQFPAEWIYASAKLGELPHSINTLGQLSVKDIGVALQKGNKVTLLLRHAERPPLDPSDTTFGETLPITEQGHRDAECLGGMLSSFVAPCDVAVYASQTFRTIQTACDIEKGLGRTPSVQVKGVLGGETPLFGSLEERMELIAEGRYLERLNEYYRMGEQRGYRPLAPAVDLMENALHCLHTQSSRLVVAVTHDINVASFLAGRGVVTEFSEKTWPHYLDAAVVFEDANGSVEYGVFRWNDTMTR